MLFGGLRLGVLDFHCNQINQTAWLQFRNWLKIHSVGILKIILNNSSSDEDERLHHSSDQLIILLVCQLFEMNFKMNNSNEKLIDNMMPIDWFIVFSTRNFH